MIVIIRITIEQSKDRRRFNKKKLTTSKLFGFFCFVFRSCLFICTRVKKRMKSCHFYTESGVEQKNGENKGNNVNWNNRENHFVCVCVGVIEREKEKKRDKESFFLYDVGLKLVIQL